MATRPARHMRGDMRWLLFSGSGRICRRTYLLGIAFWMAVLAIPVTTAVNAGESTARAVAGFGIILALLPAIASLATLSVKRLHDIGLPSGLVFLLLVPGIAVVVLFGLVVWPSAIGPNRYGPSPDRPGY